MDVRQIGGAVGILVILLLLLAAVLLICRREKCKRKVRRMAMEEKVQILNELAEPFGFFYQEEAGVFTSHLDAWQREQGYTALYDRAAAGAGMVIDAWPVYFDYQGRTWLIEFWKGQYGICTGGEIGIYHADEIIPFYFYRTAHFKAAKDEEMPRIESRVERKGELVYELAAHHWWLTGFRMGLFSKPKELRMMATLSFEDTAMAQAFLEGLQRSGQPGNKFRICCNEVYVRMDFLQQRALLSRMRRSIVLAFARCGCLLYRAAVHPFTDTVDGMLFLYYMAPYFFRRILRREGGRYKKRPRSAQLG